MFANKLLDRARISQGSKPLRLPAYFGTTQATPATESLSLGTPGSRASLQRMPMK